MEFGILGPLEVRREGQSLALGGPKQRALLAILLLHANEVVSSDRLIDLLWGEDPPGSAAKVLQVYVSQLRKILKPDPGGEHGVLVTTPPGYVLRTERDAFDLHRFEDLVTAARRAFSDGAPAEAAASLAEALELWRGAALADFTFEPFAQVEVARLEEMRLSVLEDRAEADLALGRHAEVIAQLDALLARNPTRERLARLLMTALYRAGRQAEALDVYRRVRSTLVEDLGVEPGPELQDMHRKVLAQDDSLRWVPPRSHPSPNNLPAPVTSFVGRTREIEAVTALLEKHRLVTLTGPGGCGKSRLALEAAIGALATGSDGAWLVELEPMTDAELVAHAIFATLGLKEEVGRDPLGMIADAIADSSVLLVIDNCEHVIESCAAVAETLLKSCPSLRILATSREPLAIVGERSWEVPPLSFPLAGEETIGRFADYGAIRLFVDRAGAADPEFDLDDHNAPSIAQICRRLDGMPLALELAASRMRTMSVEQIAGRLDDRFRFLTGGSRTALPRHQTLRGVMDWSYALLSEDERRLFARLSVFVGGFTLAAAERIGAAGGHRGDTVELLTRLVEKSLVSVDRRRDEARYSLLETVRAYAAEELEASSEIEPARSAHAAFFLALAEEAAPHLKGPGQRMWLEILGEEHDNLRAALGWLAATAEHEKEMRLAAALWRACYLSGHYAEGRLWLERALDHHDVSPSVRAEALIGAGALAFYQCDYDEGERRYREALALYRACGDKRGIASALTFLGGVARERAQYDRCLRLHEEALTIYRALGDSWGTADSLQMSGFASWLRGALDVAERSSGEALERFRELRDEERVAWAMMDLGAVAHYRGDEPKARRLLDESRSSFEMLGFKEGVAWSLNLTALIEIETGNYGTALTQLRDALALHRELGDRWRMCSVLEAIAIVASRTGNPEAAIRLFGAADGLRAALGTPIPPCERLARESTMAAVQVDLGTDAFAGSYEGAGAMNLEEACRAAADIDALGPAQENARHADESAVRSPRGISSR
ncbi:MAG: AfsR/SARP family transcriptional regulator [Actinomycetota bacterium]